MRYVLDMKVLSQYLPITNPDIDPETLLLRAAVYSIDPLKTVALEELTRNDSLIVLVDCSECGKMLLRNRCLIDKLIVAANCNIKCIYWKTDKYSCCRDKCSCCNKYDD